MQKKKYTLRSSAKNDIKVPEKPKTRCSGFTYHASKLYNMLPTNIKEVENGNVFKVLVKNYVWKNIPSYWVFQILVWLIFHLDCDLDIYFTLLYYLFTYNL